MGLVADPTAETRTSFGQPCVSSSAAPEGFPLGGAGFALWSAMGGGGGGGRCDAAESSFWGAFKRDAHVCTAANAPARDLYRLCDAACDAASAPLETYTTCGVPRATGWAAVVVAHGVAVLLLAAVPLTPP